MKTKAKAVQLEIPGTAEAVATGVLSLKRAKKRVSKKQRARRITASLFGHEMIKAWAVKFEDVAALVEKLL